MAKKATQEQLEAIERLRKWLPEGSTVFCIVRRVASSGMSRNIQLVYFQDGDDRHPTYTASQALGVKCTRDAFGHDTIRVQGCGMDMCEHLVNERLSYVVHGKANAWKVRTL